MNENENLPLDNIALDRLVDGELSRDEYAAALRSLEDAPDGWRRCALAFLEAQAWQREIGRMRGEARSSSAPAVPVRQPVATKPWPLLLAVAASFLVAFGLGVAFRSFDLAGLPERIAPPLAQRNAPSGERPDEQDTNRAQGAAIAAATPVPSGLVTVVVDHGDGAGGREVPVPVYEWSPESERWLSSAPLAPTLEMERTLQRLGRNVRTHRHFIPMNTGDGRDVLIPVEQMEITPAVRRVYQ